jgi:hypothetical protein
LSGREEEEYGRQVRPRVRGVARRGRPDRRAVLHALPPDGAQVLQAALLDGRRRVFLRRRRGHGRVRRGRREDEAAAAAGGGQGGARILGDHPVPRPPVGSIVPHASASPPVAARRAGDGRKVFFFPFPTPSNLCQWALRVAEAGTESWIVS